MEKGKRAKEIHEIRGADPAVEFALRRAQPGDLILIQADTVDETVSFIRNYVESIAPEPALDDSIIVPSAPAVDEIKPAPVVQTVTK